MVQPMDTSNSGDFVRLRPLSCDLGVLKRADGSARVVQGGTSVLCAVYGPAEVKASQELSDRSVYVAAFVSSNYGGGYSRHSPSFHSL